MNRLVRAYRFSNHPTVVTVVGAWNLVSGALGVAGGIALASSGSWLAACATTAYGLVGVAFAAFLGWKLWRRSRRVHEANNLRRSP